MSNDGVDIDETSPLFDINLSMVDGIGKSDNPEIWDNSDTLLKG